MELVNKTLYIYKFFVPVGLSTFYPYPTLDPNGYLPVVYYGAPILSIVVVGLTWFFRRKWKPLLFGIGFYLITVVLVLQFLPVGEAVMAERYTYLPYVGLGFVFGHAVSFIWNKHSVSQGLKFALAGGVGILFLWFAYGTYERSKVWKDSETLWTNVIDQYPEVGLAYKNRGNFRARNGRPDDALKTSTLPCNRFRMMPRFTNLSVISMQKKVNSSKQSIITTHLSRSIRKNHLCI